MLKTRFKKLRGCLNKSQKEMAEYAGVSLKSWQIYENKNIVPRGVVFQVLCEHGVNINWLLSGSGVMFKDASVIINPPETMEQNVGSNVFHVPLVKSDLLEGHFVISHHKSDAAFKKHWLTLKKLDVANLVIVENKSNSMSPTLRKGAFLLVDTGQKKPHEGAIFAVEENNVITFKRFIFLSNTEVEVTYDNPVVKTHKEKLSEVKIFGRAILCLNYLS